MNFLTESGSVYHVNKTTKKICRLSGLHDPLPIQGTDGEWKSYEEISSVVAGLPVLITWDFKNGIASMTSCVTAILTDTEFS